jgi:hypothetical protein
MIEGDVYVESCFGRCEIVLRRCQNVRFRHMFVSACGHFVLNEDKPNVTDIIRESKRHESYLTCYDWRIHVLVGSAWVYNPCPKHFTYLDHINNQKHDNRASNLRFVSPQLNSLNRSRETWVHYKKRFKKYEGRVDVDGIPERVWSKCPIEAKLKTQELLTKKFNDVYDRTVALNEGDPPKRFTHNIYWRDTHPGFAGRYCVINFGDCGADKGRFAKLSV